MIIARIFAAPFLFLWIMLVLVFGAVVFMLAGTLAAVGRVAGYIAG